MLNDIVQRALHYAPDAHFYTQQVALTKEQVAEYGLPTRPTKGVSDGNRHAKSFDDENSVELDAMDPDTLRELLEAAIEEHIDAHALATMHAAEKSERDTLSNMVDRLKE